MESKAFQERGESLLSIFSQENPGPGLSNELLSEPQADRCPLRMPRHTKTSFVIPIHLPCDIGQRIFLDC